MNQCSILSVCESLFPREARMDQCSILSDDERALNLEHAENCAQYKVRKNQCLILSEPESVLHLKCA